MLHSIIDTPVVIICGVLAGEMSTMCTSANRRHRGGELTLVARALARHHHRVTEHIVDIDDWLQANRNRQLGADALYVVWVRTDAAILDRKRSGLEIRVAIPLLTWARRRAAGASHPADTPARAPPAPTGLR